MWGFTTSWCCLWQFHWQCGELKQAAGKVVMCWWLAESQWRRFHEPLTVKRLKHWVKPPMTWLAKLLYVSTCEALNDIWVHLKAPPEQRHLYVDVEFHTHTKWSHPLRFRNLFKNHISAPFCTGQGAVRESAGRLYTHQHNFLYIFS